MTTEQCFLALIRAGVKHPSGELPEAIDWERMKALADEHGLSAVLWDAVDGLGMGRALPRGLRLDGFGTVLSYEKRYEAYQDAIASLAKAYAARGLRMMVLKGYALSLDWPVPAHRPCGDIDIWLFGRYLEGDAMLAQEYGVKVDGSHHHHTVFGWRGFSVENHYDIVNVHAHRSSAALEKVFKELALDDGCSVEVGDARVYLPSADFHALFLLRHAVSHFASTRLTVRQVLDWAFFVEKHGGEIDWKWLLATLDEYGMRGFYECLCAICVDDLGFEAGVFPSIQVDLDMKERVVDDGLRRGEVDSALKTRVLNDILRPEFQGSEPRGLLRRVWFKFRRWRANAWKHRLCYRESLLSSFFVSVWAHVLKPRSI